MLVVGLTGGIGSGKTTVANLFAEKGIPLIDTDQLAREVIQPGKTALAEIIKRFGPTLLLPDGTLNRSELRQKVFANPEDRLWLEALLHPLIRLAIKDQILKAKQAPYCMVIIPLLFETKPNPLINRILVVDAPVTLQAERAAARDKVSLAEINAIIQTQIPREKRLAGADDVIRNDGNLEALNTQVENLHQLYLKQANDSK